jgi:hypothetical protein
MKRCERLCEGEALSKHRPLDIVSAVLWQWVRCDAVRLTRESPHAMTLTPGGRPIGRSRNMPLLPTKTEEGGKYRAKK